MLIANVHDVARFLKKNHDVAKWMAAWTEITLDAKWFSIKDVRQNFPSADGVEINDGTIVTVFNVKGNSYRLLTAIDYVPQIVLILDILTHAEYSKKRWKE